MRSILAAILLALPPMAETAKALPQGYVVSSANLTVNNDAYHFDGNGLREFGKRFAASYLQAAKTTGSARPAGGPAPAACHHRKISRGTLPGFR